MAAKYWIKLYHEILHDPKMGRLPDNVWRRAIELFLLAGELDDEGHLPEIDEIAWLLRQDEDCLSLELEQLESVGIMTRNPDNTWLVSNFKARQAAVSDAERMKEYRKRKQDNRRAEQPPPSPVTPPLKDDKPIVTRSVTKRNTDTDTDTDIDIPKGGGKKPPQPNQPKKQLMSTFQQATGLKMPHKRKEQGFWWSEISEIYHIVDEDVGQGQRIIEAVVTDMQKDGLTISSPKSIVNLCRSKMAKNGVKNGQVTRETNTNKQKLIAELEARGVTPNV